MELGLVRGEGGGGCSTDPRVVRVGGGTLVVTLPAVRFFVVELLSWGVTVGAERDMVVCVC